MPSPILKMVLLHLQKHVKIGRIVFFFAMRNGIVSHIKTIFIFVIFCIHFSPNVRCLCMDFLQSTIAYIIGLGVPVHGIWLKIVCVHGISGINGYKEFNKLLELVHTIPG